MSTVVTFHFASWYFLNGKTFLQSSHGGDGGIGREIIKELRCALKIGILSHPQTA